MDHHRQLNEFLASVERRAYKIAVIATRGRDDALDIVQNAMFKLVRNYRERTPPEWPALFHTILQSSIMDWHRQKKWTKLWQRLSGHHHDDEREIDSPETEIADPVANVETTVFNHVAIAELENAIADLPLRQQQAFLLRIWEGFDVAQTAKMMGCSDGSVKTHLSRALQTLQQRLGDYYECP